MTKLLRAIWSIPRSRAQRAWSCSWSRAPVLRHGGFALGHAALDRDRAFDRIDRARELDQGTVAGQLGHAAAVVRDRRLDELLAMGPGARMRIGLARL
jgi:hypothetical protein